MVAIKLRETVVSVNNSPEMKQGWFYMRISWGGAERIFD
jgi:hypothetical protein